MTDVLHGKKKVSSWLIFAAMLVSVALTRVATIRHGITLHPDEWVFFLGADSLKAYVMGIAESFQQVKEYPEGALVLYMPFHLAADIICRLLDRHFADPQLIGRIAAVVYYLLGAALGYGILKKYLNGNSVAGLIYALIMVFSLYYIEQSRYGTGDVISFFLLMLILFLCGQALTKTSDRSACIYTLCAFFFTGILAAVKYPLAYFLIIPTAALILGSKGKTLKRRVLIAVLALAVFVLGFFACSPMASSDPMYIWRVSTRELTEYNENGNFARGGPLEHLLLLLIYSSLYSGFPMMPFIFGYAVIKCRKMSQKTPADIFFRRVLPLVIIGFAAYNLFVENMLMRTLYPFFFLVDLYVACTAAEIVKKSGVGRVLICVLTLFMVGRGIWLITVMATDRPEERLSSIILDSVDENWSKSTGMTLGYCIMPDESVTLVNPVQEHISEERYSSNDTNRLAKGELVVTGSLDYYMFQKNFLHYGEDAEDLLQVRWENFKVQNQEYYCGSLYPEYLYYLAGYWVKGSIAAAFEFPAVYVWYGR